VGFFIFTILFCNEHCKNTLGVNGSKLGEKAMSRRALQNKIMDHKNDT